jgi:hypothetical protein
MINADFEKLKAKLRKSKERGRKARVSLVNRLATMTPDQLRKVNPILIRQLGPSGLAELADRTRILADTQTAETKTSTSAPASTKHTWWKTTLGAAKSAVFVAKRKHLFKTIAQKILVATAVGLLLSFGAHLAAVVVIGNDGPTGTVSVCTSLDPWVTDCVYTTQSDTLTAMDAAKYLGESLSQFVMDNPGAPLAWPLAKGTRIHVTRKMFSPLTKF